MFKDRRGPFDNGATNEGRFRPAFWRTRWRPDPYSSEAGYSPFIDGMRAISIVGVVAFHVGMPGFSGGFVGVDIFFVISGYLIIGQILRATRASRFSFLNFYARRSLRILPPLFIVLAATSFGAAFFLVTPRELSEFGWSELFSSIMLGNHYFLRTGGYFAIEAHLKPLLHLWTLSVEEQFYLVAPVLIWGIVGIHSRRNQGSAKAPLLAPTLCIFALSLLGCIILSAGKNPAFFLMPLRVWEFIIGGMLNDLVTKARRLGRLAIEAAAAGGAILVAGSIVLLGSASSFPSGYALLPVSGAAAMLLAGAAEPRNLVARALSSPPLIIIGWLSYSWYLWHWPLIVFAHAAQFGHARFSVDLAAAFLALLLALATYVFVERRIKIRRKDILQRFGSRRIVWGALLGCVLFGVAGGLLATAAPLATLRYTGLDTTSLSALPPGGCAPRTSNPERSICLKALSAGPLGVLLGDSFANVLYPAIFAQGKSAGIDTIRLGEPGCLPVIGETSDRCPDVGRMLGRLGRAVPGKLRYAIIEAAWPHVIAPAFQARFENTLSILRELGVERILVVAPIPDFPLTAPDCVVRSDRWGFDRSRCVKPRVTAESQRKPALEALVSAAARVSDVRLIDPFDLFCDQSTCRPFEGDVLFYRDDSHLSGPGAQRVVDAFDADFRWVFGAPR
jgi:peptidoglycan/LPS O-acetylase OafA/YrhL